MTKRFREIFAGTHKEYTEWVTSFYKKVVSGKFKSSAPVVFFFNVITPLWLGGEEAASGTGFAKRDARAELASHFEYYISVSDFIGRKELSKIYTQYRKLVEKDGILDKDEPVYYDPTHSFLSQENKNPDF